MILVNLRQTWPAVLAQTDSPARATLGGWRITDERIEMYGDVILGIYENRVVTAYRVIAWQRNDNDRVLFDGVLSIIWAHLIGTLNPGRPWGRQGDANPVQWIDTGVLPRQ